MVTLGSSITVPIRLKIAIVAMNMLNTFKPVRFSFDLKNLNSMRFDKKLNRNKTEQ